MLRVVQFEVYVLDKGRWYFHARYPGAERDEAMEDARRTEIRTGYPTKVVKDTYHRDLNQSEETTAYISPNAKREAPTAMIADQRAGRLPRRQGGTWQPRSKESHAKTKVKKSQQPVNDGTFFIRLVLALGGSMVLAAALTALLGTAFNGFNKLGYEISSEAGSQISLYWYIVMFVLSAVALNRAYVPWRQLFAKRPSSSSTTFKWQAEPTTAPPPATLKPKRADSAKKAEEEKAVFELKSMRGDLDVAPSLDTSDGFMEEGRQPSNGLDPVPAPESPSSNPENSEGARESTPDPEPPATQSDTSNAAESPENTTEADPQTPLTDMDTERLIMMRFLGDTVLSLRSSHDNMDARTRFGVSLYLAGAASALADQRGLKPEVEQAVLSDALKLIGHGNAMRDSFFATYDENMDAKKNQNVIKAGEQAMLQHLQFIQAPGKELGPLLQKWHTSNDVMQPDLGDVFLLTYVSTLTSKADGSDDERMSKHNRSVRKAIADCNGVEVRHTGKGIFARFEHPDDAICAAISIQQDQERQRKSPDPLPPTRVAITASLADQSDPDFSGDVFSYSDGLCRRLSNGRIACDSLLRDACTIEDVVFDREIPTAHSGIAEKGHAIEIRWEPLPA